MWGKKSSLLLVLILFLPMSFALTINPTDYNIKDPKFNKEYNIVLTVINTKTSKYDVSAHIDRDSSYLKEYVKIQPRNLNLAPNEKKNMKLTLSIPRNISPQEHKLKINFRALSKQVGTFTLTFDVEGKQRSDIQLHNVHVQASDTQTPVYFKLETENKGNIITELTPLIELHKEGEKIDTFGKKSKMQAMPGKKLNLSLMYDPANINEGGLYSFKAHLKYANKTTEPVEKTFYLNKVKEEDNSKTVTSTKGEYLELPLTINNPTEGISFYKIEARIPGMNISKVKEGNLEKSITEANLRVDTRKLEPSEYKLNVKISKGKNLEKVEKSEYTLLVEEKRELWIYLLIPIIFGAAFLAIFYRNRIDLKNLLPDFSGAKLKKLEKEVSSISNNFDKMEANISSMGAQINKFINEANDWLDKHGKGNVRFK